MRGNNLISKDISFIDFILLSCWFSSDFNRPIDYYKHLFWVLSAQQNLGVPFVQEYRISIERNACCANSTREV